MKRGILGEVFRRQFSFFFLGIFFQLCLHLAVGAEFSQPGIDGSLHFPERFIDGLLIALGDVAGDDVVLEFPVILKAFNQ